jgi:hypothetical protein
LYSCNKRKEIGTNTKEPLDLINRSDPNFLEQTNNNHQEGLLYNSVRLKLNTRLHVVKFLYFPISAFVSSIIFMTSFIGVSLSSVT